MKTHSHRVGIRTCSDYSPFGVELDGRTVSGGYRYGFQNQEKDDEVKGVGNSVNYLFRMHDPRLGRFFSVDPLAPEYPELTTYQYASNTPIQATKGGNRVNLDLSQQGIGVYIISVITSSKTFMTKVIRD